MNQGLTDIIVFSLVILFLPVAMLGLIASVNEYADQGISGAVDCNGPNTVLIFIAPCLAVYSFGVVYYGLLRGSKGRYLTSTGLLILCMVMLSATGNKAWSAYTETIRPEHQETCENTRSASRKMHFGRSRS